MSKLNLFEIEKEYREIAQQIYDAEGELTPELEEQLAINQQQLETKGRGYGYVIKELELHNDVVDMEIARLTAIKKCNSKTADKLKETLKNSMEVFGIDKIESPTLKIFFRKSEAVIIEDEDDVPAIFKTTKEVTTTTIDKNAIKLAIKTDGEGTVAGAFIETRNNIQIK